MAKIVKTSYKVVCCTFAEVRERAFAMANELNIILHRPCVDTDNSLGEFELAHSWFKELVMVPSVYEEPELDNDIVDFIKLACSSLKQDEHVFVMVVDVVEKICHMSKQTNATDVMSDPLLLIASVILLCSKTVGVQCELKVKHVQIFLDKVIDRHYETSLIKKHEIVVTKILGCNLPHTSQMDDLKVLLYVYVAPLKLKKDIQPLSVEILQIIYLTKKEFFQKLKQFYGQNETARELFQNVVTKKLYVPAGVVLCALSMTNYRNFLDLDKITAELECILCIHKDSLRLLVDVIYSIIVKKSVL